MKSNIGSDSARSASFLPALLCLAVGLAALQAKAATKPWVMLTNCQYLAHADNDGDSFRVRNGTNEYRFRLYFVDAPEVNLVYPDRTRQQAEYYGATLDDTLKAGRQARDLTRETLREPFVVWTRWASASGRSTEPRYYALVQVGTNGLAEILVRAGLAQPKGVRPNLPTGEKSSAYEARLQALEADARQRKAGVWAQSTKN